MYPDHCVTRRTVGSSGCLEFAKNSVTEYKTAVTPMMNVIMAITTMSFEGLILKPAVNHLFYWK